MRILSKRGGGPNSKSFIQRNAHFTVGIGTPHLGGAHDAVETLTVLATESLSTSPSTSSAPSVKERAMFITRHDAKDVKMLKAKQFNKERG